MSVHAWLEGLVDWWQERRDRAFRAALRRRLRKDRTFYLDRGPDKKCIVRNEPGSNR